jgi:hypothetical protein
LPVQIQLRRGTENEWSSSDPILALGELAISIDAEKIKIGDGSSLWSELDYINVLPSELDSDNILEGTTNLFFTPERAVEAVAGGTFDTDVVEEGTLNLYFTDLRAQDATPGRITSSSTQPESPSAGDGWLDISTGKLYVYIADEDSSQWIEV